MPRWLLKRSTHQEISFTHVFPSAPQPHPAEALPQWQAAPEPSHEFGLVNEASEDSYAEAARFCSTHPPEPPRILPWSELDAIARLGCGAWCLAPPPAFRGSLYYNNPYHPGVVKVVTERACGDSCLLSNLPILAGQYVLSERQPGVYFEVTVGPRTDHDAVIAIGTACRPYPPYRLPGWNRLSAGLHLDDLRKFFEDPDGGQEYTGGPRTVAPGDTVGLGYAYAGGEVFFTHNGVRCAVAFTGVYMPHERHDVYAALGVCGRCECDVNFGAAPFKWVEGEKWKVSAHVGFKLRPPPDERGDELPSYSEVR